MSSWGTMPASIGRIRQREIDRQRESARIASIRRRSGNLSEKISSEILKLQRNNLFSLVESEVIAIEKSAQKAKSDIDSEEHLSILQRSLAEASLLEELASKRLESKQASLNRSRLLLEEMRIELCEILVALDGPYSEMILSLLHKTESKIEHGIESETECDDFILETRATSDSIRAEAEEKTNQEESRRMIVGSLVNSMRESGLSVVKPRLLSESKNVAVLGTMSSGRKVRFEVSETGDLEFNLDGYKERECAGHLEQIIERMEETLVVEVGPVQYNWKNPDRVHKGARRNPTGAKFRGSMR